MSGISSIFSGQARLTGLSSNLDTDAIVESLLSIEQLKVDRQERSMTELTWYLDAQKSVGDKLKTFRSTYLSMLGSSSMVAADTYKSFKVTKITGENAVSVHANAEAMAGKITVNNITQLAENAKAVSAGKVSADGTAVSAGNLTPLSELKFANGLGFVDGEICFSINGKEFAFKETDTLQSMVNTINADSEANVTFTYSRLTDTFSVQSKKGGAGGEVAIENIRGNAFGENSAFGIAGGSYKNGKNAQLTIEGVAVERDSNNFTIDGINYTLNETTDTKSTFLLEQDVSASVEKIKGFLEAYNSLVSEMSGLISEQKDYDYTPLTKAEREAMSEDDIKLWEQKAKVGILGGNGALRNMLSELRSVFSSALGGTGKTMSDIGLTSGSYFTTDRGKIVVDDYALSEALKKNPDRVMSMFTSTGTSTAESTGAMQRMTGILNDYLNNVQRDDIEDVEDKIGDFEDKITELQDRMITLSERYYQKYAALETAMSKLNSQSQWLASQLSALG